LPCSDSLKTTEKPCFHPQNAAQEHRKEDGESAHDFSRLAGEWGLGWDSIGTAILLPLLPKGGEGWGQELLVRK